MVQISAGKVVFYGWVPRNPPSPCAPTGVKVPWSLKGIFSDSNNIFLWHKSEDINKKKLFPMFQLILILHS